MSTLAPVKCCHCNDADVHIYPTNAEGVECHHNSCKTVFHARCCMMAARRVGLLCGQTNTAHMFCAAHCKDLREARKKQAIMLKHVQTARSAYLAGNAVPAYDPRAEAVAQTTKASTHTVNPVNVVGMRTQTPLPQLCAACPIDEGGFCQRAVASFAASTIETLIRDNGYDVGWELCDSGAALLGRGVAGVEKRRPAERSVRATHTAPLAATCRRPCWRLDHRRD